MNNPLKNNYPHSDLHWDAGRIPECLAWNSLGTEAIEAVKKILKTEDSFNPAAITAQGWVGVIGKTDGQLDDGDIDLLPILLKENNINPVYVTSLSALNNSKNGAFLGACVFNMDSADLVALRFGGWCVGEWIEKLESHDLLWNSWDAQVYFNWPITFAMVQLCEGGGRTTLVGPKYFIDEFLSRSRPENYGWDFMRL
jgi:hypothetical protein